MPVYQNSNLLFSEHDRIEGSTTWRSPSNLALIKYWGKHGVQLPRNPSISFTLDAAHTTSNLHYQTKDEQTDRDIQLTLFLDGEINHTFQEKTTQFLTSLLGIFPFLKQLKLTLHTSNSFPHSAGIASSASGMSALALCLCHIERKHFATLQTEIDFLQKASYIARLGSGSACRSVYPVMAAWGQTPFIDAANDQYAVPFETELHPIYKNYQNSILIASRKEKSVSSRAGHSLMENNPYAAARYQQANEQMGRLVAALRQGDLTTFGDIVESEALTLHALMMSSQPSYILMHPNSLNLINKVRAFRQETKLPLYFSLDAGPNLHLLYPENDKEKILQFIENELLVYCEKNEYIKDKAGRGALEIV